VATAVDKSPAYARLLAVAPAGDLPTAPTPPPGARPSSTSPVLLRAERAQLDPSLYPQWLTRARPT